MSRRCYVSLSIRVTAAVGGSSGYRHAAPIMIIMSAGDAELACQWPASDRISVWAAWNLSKSTSRNLSKSTSSVAGGRLFG